MKVSYLLPRNQYRFFHDIVPYLQNEFINVEVNKISPDSDLILVGIFPCSSEWQLPIEQSRKPFVLWHWDYYSFVDFTSPRWRWFLNNLPMAADIWSCTYEVARQLKEIFSLDSYMMPAWVNFPRLPEAFSWESCNFVFYASSSGAFGKQVHWAEQACKLARLPLKLTKGIAASDAEYFKSMASCRVYLMTAFEESNATIPAQEAGAMGKPVVLADLPSSKEVFGETAYYYRNGDFGHLLRVLKEAWRNGPICGTRDRIYRNFNIQHIANRIAERLRNVHANLQTRNR